MQKSIVELRGIAQAIGAKYSFGDDANKLQRAIDKRLAERIPEPPPLEESTPMDHRLRSKPPARGITQRQLDEALSDHKGRGLKLYFPKEETWQISFNKKHDSGTLRMPLRVILKCADEILR